MDDTAMTPEEKARAEAKELAAQERRRENERRQVQMLADFQKVIDLGEAGVGKVKAMLEAKMMKDEDKLDALGDFRAALNTLNEVLAPDQAP